MICYEDYHDEHKLGVVGTGGEKGVELYDTIIAFDILKEFRLSQ
jgi:hypothetical protein